MPTVFLSYSKNDRDIASALAKALEDSGYGVWWDHKLASGEAFRAEIKRKIGSADAVVVIWTEHSVESEWVLDEAEEAKAAGKLFPVRLPSLDYRAIPLGFRSLQTDMLDEPARLIQALERKGVGPPSVSGETLFDNLLDAVRKRSRPAPTRRVALVGAAAGILGGAAAVRTYDWWSAKRRLVRSIKVNDAAASLVVIPEDDQGVVSIHRDGAVAFIGRAQFAKTAEARLPIGKVVSAHYASRPRQEIFATDGAKIGSWTRETEWNLLSEPATDQPYKQLQVVGAHPSERRLFSLLGNGTVSEWQFGTSGIRHAHDYALAADAVLSITARRIAGTVPILIYATGSTIRFAQANRKPREDDSFMRNWVLEGHGGPVRHFIALPLSTAPNVFVFSASDDGTIRMWDMYSLRFLHAFAGHEGPVTALALLSSETSTMLISGGADGTVRAWNPQRRSPAGTIGSHRSAVTAVAITRDGTQVVSGSAEGELRLWSIGDLSFDLLAPPSRS